MNNLLEFSSYGFVAFAGGEVVDYIVPEFSPESFLQLGNTRQSKLVLALFGLCIELLQSPEQVAGLGTGLEQFAVLFRQGIEEGDFVDDDPELMARMVIACQQVRLAMWMDDGCQSPPTRVVEASLRHLLRSYCRPARLAAALRSAGLEEES